MKADALLGPSISLRGVCFIGFVRIKIMNAEIIRLCELINGRSLHLMVGTFRHVTDDTFVLPRAIAQTRRQLRVCGVEILAARALITIEWLRRESLRESDWTDIGQSQNWRGGHQNRDHHQQTNKS